MESFDFIVGVYAANNAITIQSQYPGLPKNIQDNFSYYRDAQSGYAIVKVVFGNSGDRAGILRKGTIQKTLNVLLTPPDEQPSHDVTG